MLADVVVVGWVFLSAIAAVGLLLFFEVVAAVAAAAVAAAAVAAVVAAVVVGFLLAVVLSSFSRELRPFWSSRSFVILLFNSGFLFFAYSDFLCDFLANL